MPPSRLPAPAGKVLSGWEVFPLQLDDVGDLSLAAAGQAGAGLVAAARRRLLEAAPVQAHLGRGSVAGSSAAAPAFFRHVHRGSSREHDFAMFDKARQHSILSRLLGPPSRHWPAGAPSRWMAPARCAAPRATWPTRTWRCTAGARASPG